MRIYLAGPISGKGYDEVVGMYKEKSNILKNMGYDILCPMTGKQYLRNEIEFKAIQRLFCKHAFHKPNLL